MRARRPKATWRILTPRLKCPHCGRRFYAFFTGRWAVRAVDPADGGDREGVLYVGGTE